MNYLRFCAVVAGALAGGCGLISSDVTNLDLTVKPKMFAIDSASWNVNSSAANTFLGFDCSSQPTYCGTAVANACTMGCSGTCDPSSHRCELGLDIGIWQGVDLQSEQPELKTINKQPLIHVTIDSVTYTVITNTLSVPTPQLTIYVAPASVMNPGDPSAKAVGTIDPVPAMMTESAREMTYTAEGKQALIDTMGSYMTPFNVLVGGELQVRSGDPLPAGKLEAVVQIKAHAGV
jgi:hypothetical protein